MTFLRSTWGLLGLFTSLKKTYLMSFRKFQYAFGNGMPYAEQKKAYDACIIPESKAVARGGLIHVAAVDMKRKYPPLLITAGRMDNTIPAGLSLRVFKAYRHNESTVDYQEFDTSHNVLTGQGWQEEAAYIANWLEERLPRRKEFNLNNMVWGSNPSQNR